MYIEYTLVEKEEPKGAHYEVHVEYSHGDADSTSQDTVDVVHFNDLERFLKDFKEVADRIDNSRSSGTALPDNYDELVSNTINPLISLVSDRHYQDTYAEMHINAVVYFDDLGREFTTEITKVGE